jgi:hypothetical protein
MATMMQLGATTFTQNPGKMTLPQANKSSAVVQTYEGAAYFSWGTLLVGQVLTLQWEICPVTQYNAIHALLVADAAVNFIPGNGTTYSVEVMKLTGSYFMDQTATAEYRENVTLELLILGTV